MDLDKELEVAMSDRNDLAINNFIMNTTPSATETLCDGIAGGVEVDDAELISQEGFVACGEVEETGSYLSAPNTPEYIPAAVNDNHDISSLEDASDKVKRFVALASEKASSKEPKIVDYGHPKVKQWIDKLNDPGEPLGPWEKGMDVEKWGFVPLRYSENQMSYVPRIRGWTKEPKRWWLVKKEEHLAVLPNVNYIVLDADTPLQTMVILSIVKAKGLKCKVMLTKHGGHFYFKAPKGVAGTREWSVRAKKAMVINLPDVDFRGLGAATVTFRKDGKNFQWVYGVEYQEEELDELPYYFYPMKKFSEEKAAKYQFLGLHDGDLRNDKLFRYFSSLAHTGYSFEQCREIIGIINDFVMAEPKSGQEIKTICREEAYQNIINEASGQQFYDENKRFRHDWFGNHLIETEHVIALEQHGQLAIYRNGYYPVMPDNVYVRVKMREILPDITNAKIKEVEAYIWDTLKGRDEVTESVEDGYWVNLQNGRFNMKTGEFTDHTPDARDFVRVPIIYNQDAQSVALDKMLKAVTCDDEQMVTLLDEMVGYCFVRNCDYDTVFILTNKNGSNGKSTFLEGIRRLIGTDNVSAITLQQYSEKFINYRLYKKLANIYMDLPITAIKDAGMIKTASSGEPITVQEKNCPAFEIEPYATPIFACNGIPEIYDHSGGMDRRLCLIPFDATFSSNDPDFDPTFKQQICTEEAKSAWFNRAFSGYQKLLADGKFITVGRCEALKRRYRDDSNDVLNWFMDKEITAEILNTTSIIELYTNNYVEYIVKDSGQKHPRPRRSFSQEVRRLLGIADGRKRKIVNGKKISVFNINDTQQGLATLNKEIAAKTSGLIGQ